MRLNNFVVIESEYGRFIVNRHCAYQAEHLIKTGRPHIQEELEKILTVVGRLPENCIIVDAGANIGLVAVPMAQAIAARGGMVHAFEAQRIMSYALSGAAALNDLENLVVHHKALGASVGTVGIPRPDYGKPQDFGEFSLLGQQDGVGDSIETITIDSMKLERLDFLKIDVEGMEIEVLKGGSNTIRRDQPFAWVEYWKSDIDGIKAQFAELDYKFFVMDKLNMLCAPTAKSAQYGLSIKAQEI